MPPLVSVILPAYNAERYIRDALASVCGQSYGHLEILVVDDGSTDATVRVVSDVARRDSRIRLLRQANAGVAAARNAAIDASTGLYVAPIDADDMWHAEKIAQQVACLEQAAPEAGLVYTWWTIIDETGRVSVPSIRPSEEGWVYTSLIRQNFLGNASVPLFRRRCLQDVGAYDTAMHRNGGQGCEDWDLALRIAEKYPVCLLKECLTYYRKVEASMSTQTQAMVSSQAMMLQKAQTRNPDLSDDLIRTSQAGFERYIARTSFIDGNHRDAFMWSCSSARLDAQTMITWKSLTIAVLSLGCWVLHPIASRLWPRRRTWLALRRAWMRLRGPLPIPPSPSPPISSDPESSTGSVPVGDSRRMAL